MEKQQSSKLKTLYIYQFLNKYSDENNPLSATDLISMLEEVGIKAERKSIYSDIESLRIIGCDIVGVKTPKNGYFMASRLFEIPEVMLLVDAVSSAGFITPKKTASLISKLDSLVSVHQAKTMQSQVYVESETNKCDNEEIYITIDRLHEAITERKKVKFVYKKRNIDVKNMKRHTEKTHTISPYGLIWKNDHYYLVGNSDRFDDLGNYRIDRIKRLTILDEKARPIDEVSDYKGELDEQDYAARQFNMFSGEPIRLSLKCSLSIQEEMLDRFGKNIPLIATDGSHFKTTVDASLSDGLVSWLMQYGNKVEVLEPTVLRDMIKNKAQSIVDLY